MLRGRHRGFRGAWIDDDDLRLVFSDWLEDQDDGRAEFLRLQVKRRRLAPEDPGQAELVRQQNDLILRAQRGWLLPLAPYAVSILRGNGLLRVTMTGSQVRDLTPDDLEDPAWNWVDGLRLYRLVPDDFEATFTAPALSHFRQIDLSGSTLEQEGLLALVANRKLERLNALNLEQTKLPYGGMAQLAGASWLPRLMALNLGNNMLGNLGLRELFQAGHFDALRVLDLSRCEIGSMGIASLLATTFFPRLEALGLAYNDLGDEEGRRLAQVSLTHLRALDLRGTSITSRVAALLRQRCSGLIL